MKQEKQFTNGIEKATMMGEEIVDIKLLLFSTWHISLSSLPSPFFSLFQEPSFEFNLLSIVIEQEKETSKKK